MITVMVQETIASNEQGQPPQQQDRQEPEMQELLIPQPPPHVQGPPDDPEVGGGPQRDRLPGDLHPLHNGAGSPQPSAIGNTRPRRNTRLPDRYTDADYDVSTIMLTGENYHANFPAIL